MVTKSSLVLFSGGKDSFITACKEIEAGYHVYLISFNNGAMAAEENLVHGVKRLQNRYGKDCVEYAGVYNTAALIMRLNEAWTYMPQKELGEKYPNLINAQLTCLHCQSAMWVSAVAYANAHGISRIVTGYRKSDSFCTGHDVFLEGMKTLASHYNISVEFPVWNTPKWDETHGWERNCEMNMRSFLSKVLEPKCLLGRPTHPMSETEKQDMTNFFNTQLKPLLLPQVKNLIPIFRCIQLEEKSLVAIEYPVPDGKDGYY